MFARNCSPFSASGLEVAMRSPRLLRSTQAPLQLQCRDLEKFEERAPELLGSICEVEHPSEAVDVSNFWVLLLLLLPLCFSSFCYAL